MGFPTAVIAGASAVLVAGLSIPVIRRIALARGAVVACRVDRWHTVATPAFGGVGIFLAVLVGM
ncbi:MAG: undecaprenyl/decaprenyl-phosphate alpha-N-acetylglucosaminyl 1-phosphate transferase, partial [Longimicrobiales bacterium]